MTFYRVLCLGFVLVACLLANTSAQEAPLLTPVKESDSAGVSVEKVDIGGRKLAVAIRGTGEPTVVIEAGFGLAAVESDEWNAVCNEIAKTNRVILYNRAGLGASDPPSSKPRTCQDVSRDLHALLTSLEVKRPYVLVGHSLGGMHVRVYSGLFADELAGVVLVDSAHPDQDAKWLEALPPESSEVAPSIKRAREFLASRVADKGNNSEALDRVASREQARAVKSLGAIPLAVLTHSPNWKMVPDLPEDVLKRIEQISQELQATLPSLSTNGTHTIAKKAGHAIHVDEPDLVISAIREVVKKVSAK